MSCHGVKSKQLETNTDEGNEVDRRDLDRRDHQAGRRQVNGLHEIERQKKKHWSRGVWSERVAQKIVSANRIEHRHIYNDNSKYSKILSLKTFLIVYLGSCI